MENDGDSSQITGKQEVRSYRGSGPAQQPPSSRVGEDAVSPLFEAAAEATEEAIDNSLLKAQTVRGRDGHVAEAIPLAGLRAILAESGVGK